VARFSPIAALSLLFTITLVALVGLTVGPAAAQDDSSENSETTESTESGDDTGGDEQAAEDELLREGAAVYGQVCSACHQPGGVGLEGSFPPLIDNSNVADASYVEDVIANGLQGPIEVQGVTYDGVMPSFSTLAEEDVDAVVFYVQSGFQAPSGPTPEIGSGPVAGTELPALADLTWIAAYLIAAFVALLVIGPRLAAQSDRLSMPWFDAWLKTGTIVVGTVLAVAFIPNWVLQTSTVAGWSRPAQDLIGVSVWGLGLALCLGALWYAHRDSRI
jgi:mono/diheme cytochrome c family protein